MAELPKSWGLKTRRKNGKLQVIGKDDSGRDYVVRTCKSGSLTDSDVAGIAESDRERYPSREAGAQAYVSSLMEQGEKQRQRQEDSFMDDLTEAAGPVVRVGLGHEGSTEGYSNLKFISPEHKAAYLAWLES